MPFSKQVSSIFLFEVSIAPGGGIDKNYPPKAESSQGEALHLILPHSPGVPARIRFRLRASFFSLVRKETKSTLREKTRIRFFEFAEKSAKGLERPPRTLRWGNFLSAQKVTKEAHRG